VSESDRNDVEALLRASLQERAEDVRPDPATWSKVADGVRRAQLWRWSLAGAGAFAAVALAAFVVPLLLNRTTVEFADQPDGTPGETAAPGLGGVACGGPAHVTAVLARTGEGLEGTIWALCDDGSQSLLDNRRPEGVTDTNPALSWDGASVVFERQEADDVSVLIHVDLRTGRQSILGGGALPAFAPDGRMAWVQRVDQGQDRVLVGRPFEEPELEFGVVEGEDGEWFDARRLAWDASGETIYAEIGYDTSVVHAYDVGALYRSSVRGSVNGTRVQELRDDERYAGPSAAPSPNGLAVVSRCCGRFDGDRFTTAELRVLDAEGQVEREVGLPAGFDANGRVWTAWAPAGPLRQNDDGAYTWSGGSRPLYLVGDGKGVWAVEPDGRTTRIDAEVSSAATNPALSGSGPGAPPSAVAAGEAPEQGGLPYAVRTTRQRIWEAARARDFDALRELMPDGFRSSFGADNGPDPAIDMLRDMEQRGEDPFGLILRLLASPYGVQTPGPSGYFAWPRPFTIEAAEWTDEDVQILRDLGATDADIAGYREFGGYIGWRIGIRDNGEWEYLVRGD
jgi:hypothetical protein